VCGEPIAIERTLGQIRPDLGRLGYVAAISRPSAARSVFQDSQLEGWVT
jgi:hypothetical protein